MAETDQTEIEEQLAVWEARGDGKTAQEEPRGPAKVIQLPLWPEPKRGAPNAVLRGALFAAIHKDRRYMDRELLAAQDGITVWFTGKQLDQSDLDVWEQTLHLARTQALGTRCYFTAHGFLKALGRQTGKSGHEWLKSVFSRLSATDVQISHKGWTYFGSLIEGGARDEDTGRYVVKINPKLAAFYGRDAVDADRLGAAPASTWQVAGAVVAWILCQPRCPLPAARGLPAQAQRQPDQADETIQRKPVPGAAGSRSGRRDPGLRDPRRSRPCPDRTEQEPAEALGRPQATQSPAEIGTASEGRRHGI